MPQLSLYVTDESLEMLRSKASSAGLSMSKYVNRLIQEDAQSAGWPRGFWELYGALGDGFTIPEDPPPADNAKFERLFA